MKLVALMGGGDWTDASVDHLAVPDDLDLETAKKAHSAYYVNTYWPALMEEKKPKPESFSLAEWLCKHHGARKTTEKEIEEYWE